MSECECEHLVGPLIVLNLGVEMLFVVSQRLQAQNITAERATHVLDELTCSLLRQPAVEGLGGGVVPQVAVPGHQEVRRLVEDVAQSSAMRLDPVSMDRLWDLVTVVFKWQVTVCPDVLLVTQRHVHELELLSGGERVLALRDRLEALAVNPRLEPANDRLVAVNPRVGSDIQAVNPRFAGELRHQVLSWLSPFSARISLLLRLGFQRRDGELRTRDLDQRYVRLVDRAGENIYAATRNLELPPRALHGGPPIAPPPDLELRLAAQQILGRDDTCQRRHTSHFKLSLSDTYNQTNTEQQTPSPHVYSQISVSNTNESFKDIFDDISVSEDADISDLHDELLNILDEDCM